MLAIGEIGLGDAADTIATWVDNTTGVDRSGLRVRLNWVMRDRAKTQQRSRLNAATAIRWAARRLLTINASQAEIEEALDEAAADDVAAEEAVTASVAERTAPPPPTEDVASPASPAEPSPEADRPA